MENNTIQDEIDFLGQTNQIEKGILPGQLAWLGMEEKSLPNEKNTDNEERAMLDISGQKALLLRDLSETDDEELMELLLVRLCALQMESNRLLSQLSKDCIGGNGVSNGNGEISNADLIGIGASVLTIEEVLTGGALAEIFLHLWRPAAIGLIEALGPYALVGLTLYLGYEALKIDSPDLFDGSKNVVPMSKEETEKLVRDMNTGRATAEHFEKSYGDIPYARNLYLDYLEINDQERWKRELEIADRGYSFSQTEEQRIIKGLEKPQPRPFKAEKEWTDAVNSVIYESSSKRNKSSIVNSQEIFEQSLHFNKAFKSDFSASNMRGEAEHQATEAEDAFSPNSPMTQSSIQINGSFVGIPANLSIEVWEKFFNSPYHLGQAATIETFNDEKQITNAELAFLIDSFNQLAAAYVQPNVTVGSLANTLVVREEADIDRIAAELARRLKETQMVS